MIQAAIRHHTPLFYNRWRASGHQLALQVRPAELAKNSQGDRWRLYIDVVTSEPDQVRSEIAKALCPQMNIRELDLVVAEGWTVMGSECQEDTSS